MSGPGSFTIDAAGPNTFTKLEKGIGKARPYQRGEINKATEPLLSLIFVLPFCEYSFNKHVHRYIKLDPF